MAHTAATLSGVNDASTRSSSIRFLLQVSRPGLWTTTTLFYLMPLGNFSGLLNSARFWSGLLYILFPLSFLLYGVNDIADAEGDRLNPRKGTFLFGSRGGEEQLRRLRWQIIAVQLPFALAFFLWIGLPILLWFGALLAAVALYNAPRIGWKGRPPLDVLIQASYLLVFLLSSWVNQSPQLPWQTFVFGGLFAMHSHVFGEVMDIVPDQAIGRRTTATMLGPVRTKLLIGAILCVECAWIARYFRDWPILIFLGAGVAWFLCDSLLLWKERPYRQQTMRVFMLAWNAAAVAGIAWNFTHHTLTQAARTLG